MTKQQTLARKAQRAAAALQHQLHVLPDPVRVAKQANLLHWLGQSMNTTRRVVKARRVAR